MELTKNRKPTEVEELKSSIKIKEKPYSMESSVDGKILKMNTDDKEIIDYLKSKNFVIDNHTKNNKN